MAVSKSAIKAAYLAAMNTASISELSNEDWADLIADVIRDAILSADVETTVIGTLPDGPVSASGSGGLS